MLTLGKPQFRRQSMWAFTKLEMVFFKQVGLQLQVMRQPIQEQRSMAAIKLELGPMINIEGFAIKSEFMITEQFIQAAIEHEVVALEAKLHLKQELLRSEELIGLAVAEPGAMSIKLAEWALLIKQCLEVEAMLMEQGQAKPFVVLAE